jgi:hypothetical protein
VSCRRSINELLVNEWFGCRSSVVLSLSIDVMEWS